MSYFASLSYLVQSVHSSAKFTMSLCIWGHHKYWQTSSIASWPGFPGVSFLSPLISIGLAPPVGSQPVSNRSQLTFDARAGFCRIPSARSPQLLYGENPSTRLCDELSQGSFVKDP